MKKIIALILALTLALTLAACNKSGNNPTGDNSTPGTSSTPGTTSKPSDNASKPVLVEPEIMNTETKARIDNRIANLNGRYGIDIENSIDKIYDQYWKYINEKFNKTIILVGVDLGTSSTFTSKDNLTGISDKAMNDVNKLLKEKGEQELDIKNPEQNIAALWIAASLYFDPNYKGDGEKFRDITMAFGLARADSRANDAERNASELWSVYASLFSKDGLFDLIQD